MARELWRTQDASQRDVGGRRRGAPREARGVQRRAQGKEDRATAAFGEAPARFGSELGRPLERERCERRMTKGAGGVS